MRPTLTLLLLGITMGPAFGESAPHPFLVTIQHEAELQWFVENDINVINRDGSEITLHITQADEDRLRTAGYHPRPSPPPNLPKGLGTYTSYDAMTALLEDYAATYPAIVRLSSLGQSVEGRELWVLLITDNPEVEEDEAEFKYVATMHGDEPVGYEMCLLLIDRLLRDYGSSDRITNLVNTTAISIVPLMNPDGFESIRRSNANGFDLNRSFPAYPDDFTGTIFSGAPLSDANRPPEVAHVLNWTAANSFVLSANLHGGALLVNYPFDEEPGIPSGTDAPTPDDELFRALSLEYSRNNPPMFASPSFPQGITNGSEWFSISGGMQDWNYRYAACFDVTIEISNTKRPSPDQLLDFWAANEESMLAYMEGVHLGARGIVTNRANGEPLYAKILVQENPLPVFTDPDVGDYHRLLLPGDYTLVVRAPDFISYRMALSVTDGPAVRADAQLSDGDVNLDGQVDAVDVQLVINAILDLGESTFDCDVDGMGVTSTDVQVVVNRALDRTGSQD